MFLQHNIQSLSAADLPEGLQVAVSAVSMPLMSETSPTLQGSDGTSTSQADSWLIDDRDCIQDL